MSVIGISSLFSGEMVAVMVMASALELAKIVAAAWLKTHWGNADILTKLYLTGAVVILCGITSMGAFGYLSKAHLAQDGNASISSIQTGGIVDQINLERSRRHPRINALTDLNAQLVTARINEQGQSADLGPLKYASAIVYGHDADKHSDEVMRAMILLIVAVFDPLAIMLWVAGAGGINRGKAGVTFAESNLIAADKKMSAGMREVMVADPESDEVPATCSKRTLSALYLRGLADGVELPAKWTDLGMALKRHYLEKVIDE